MQYLLMIYGDEAAMHGITPEEGMELGEAYARFTQDIVQSGHLKGGDQLKPSNTATTIRRGNGKSLMTDGPFAERASNSPATTLLRPVISTKR